MKRQTTIGVVIKLLAGLSLFTGIIGLIFFTFIFFHPQATKSPSSPTPSSPDKIGVQSGPTLTVTPAQGKFCGGIGTIRCPDGFTCKLSGSYPDASGTCVHR